LSSVALLAVAAALAADAPAPASGGAATAAQAPTRTVRAAGQTFGYRSIGSGRPIVLLQGLSGTMDGWDPTFVDALARGGRRVLLVDNAGIGRTTKRPGSLSIRMMADDAARFIRAVKLGRPDVVGWSMGGMIAQSLAVRHPRSVRRLVLLSSAPGDGRSTPPTPEGFAALTGSGDAATAGNVLFPPGHQAAARRFLRNLATRKRARGQAPGSVVRAQVVASGAWLSGGDPDGRKISRLRIPVLVGGGALDALLPVANQRHLGRVIPRAQLVVYADASHGFFLQRARDFLPRLRRFLAAG
jgi:pimeloyl-ACP methyl ester carboxylesterase